MMKWASCDDMSEKGDEKDTNRQGSLKLVMMRCQEERRNDTAASTGKDSSWKQVQMK